MNNGLCTPCSQIVINDERPLEQYNFWVNEPHHQSLLELKNCAENAQRSCPLCRLFWMAIQLQNPADKVEKYVYNWDTTICKLFSLNLSYDVDLATGKRTDEEMTRDLKVGAGGEEQTLSICIGGVVFGCLSISAPVDPSGQAEIRGSRVKESKTLGPDSEVISIAKRWLIECDEHARCKQQSHLPDRVVYIGGPNPKVVEKSKQTDRYVALTYSWGEGNDEMVKFEEDNREKFLRGEIEESSLAPTHQEAIRLARELGCEYIWIDALCIDQNDWDNWAEQSTKVPDIYGNAYVTIVAGRSKDSRDGFLEPTHKPDTPIVPLPHRPRFSHEQSECWVGMRRNYKIGPTDYRAWCYQEGLIARRMLIFGEQQLSFRCRERHVFEDGSWRAISDEDDDWYCLSFLSQYLPPSEASEDGKLPREFEVGIESRQAKSRRSFDPIRNRWYAIAEEYSIRSFYDPADIHGAFSGLVIRFQQAFSRWSNFEPCRIRYMAGLWDIDMLNGLLWLTDPSLSAIPRRQAKNGSWEEIRRAPTWSWMALTGPKYQRIFHVTTGEFDICKPANADGITWGPDPDGWGPKVTKYLEFPDPFKLEIVAYVREVRLSEYKIADCDTSEQFGFWYLNINNQNSCTIPSPSLSESLLLLEAAEKGPQRKALGLMPLDRTTMKQFIAAQGLLDLDRKDIQNMTLWAMRVVWLGGLLLKRIKEANAEGPAVYERLGVFSIYSIPAFYPEEYRKVTTKQKPWFYEEGIESEVVVLV